MAAKSSPKTKQTWLVDDLRVAYGKWPDSELGKRLLRVLNWADENKFFFPTTAEKPVFGLRGKSGKRIMSFSPEWTVCYLDEMSYTGGRKERDKLVDEMKSLGMYDSDFNPQTIPSDSGTFAGGRQIKKKLTDLSDPDFKKFLETLARYC